MRNSFCGSPCFITWFFTHRGPGIPKTVLLKIGMSLNIHLDFTNLGTASDSPFGKRMEKFADRWRLRIFRISISRSPKSLASRLLNNVMEPNMICQL